MPRGTGHANETRTDCATLCHGATAGSGLLVRLESARWRFVDKFEKARARYAACSRSTSMRAFRV